ncbi:hypothetical protein B0H66DRAFT_526111 [Apodospora peruviana]|uniref:Uncharacterized protein n=1 Tax=Apodospora peruviana TaxID=516989 RepID=A0AAE0MDS1_9PEZI|nr:hypothetical protein B0H66DRAFT_526111 [Apodospora peruviana]
MRLTTDYGPGQRKSGMEPEPFARRKPLALSSSSTLHENSRPRLGSADPSLGTVTRRSWPSSRSFQKQPSANANSALDHITNAEDIYETQLFRPTTGDGPAVDGGGLTRIPTNSGWEQSMLVRSPQEMKTEDLPGRPNENITETVASFLLQWESSFRGRLIPTHYLRYEEAPLFSFRKGKLENSNSITQIVFCYVGGDGVLTLSTWTESLGEVHRQQDKQLGYPGRPDRSIFPLMI